MASNSDTKINKSDAEWREQLTEEQSTNLCKVAQENDFEINIIAYVRDVYDITYSSYQQLVKRHTYTHRFDEFALGRENLQQFGVVRKLVESEVGLRPP